jgi:dihydroorotate dehydrogenase (NAD+) catalytic subunit
VGPLSLRNPILTASGTFGYGSEFEDLMDLSALGGIVTKSLSRLARPGNPTPRIAETASGMLNAIGLENCGLDAFLKHKLPALRGLKTAVVVNVVGKHIDEFAAVCAAIQNAHDEDGGVAGIELNISCPNVSEGLDFSTDAGRAEQLVASARKATSRPLLVKLSPNVTDIRVIAKAAEAGGADGLSMINTLVGMAIDVTSRRPKIANVTGGLSGPAIKPVAIRMVHQVSQAVDIPIVGIGGIATVDDVIEFLLAGATAVQVGTTIFSDPTRPQLLAEALATRIAELGAASVRELIGGMKKPTPPEATPAQEAPR